MRTTSQNGLSSPYIFISTFVLLVIIVFIAMSSNPPANNMLMLFPPPQQQKQQHQKSSHKKHRQSSSSSWQKTIVCIGDSNTASSSVSSSSLVVPKRNARGGFKMQQGKKSSSVDAPDAALEYSDVVRSPSLSERNFGRQYPDLLAGSFAADQARFFNVVNLGIPNTACSRKNTKHSVWRRDRFKNAVVSVGQRRGGGGGDDDPSFPNTVDWSRADVAVIMFGTNDAREKVFDGVEEFESCLSAMVNQVTLAMIDDTKKRRRRKWNDLVKKKKAGEAAQQAVEVVKKNILLLTPPPVNPSGYAVSKYRVNTERLARQIVPGVRNVAKRFRGNMDNHQHSSSDNDDDDGIGGNDIIMKKTKVLVTVTLVDVFKRLSEKYVLADVLTDDGVHLSDMGSKLVAQMVMDAVV